VPQPAPTEESPGDEAVATVGPAPADQPPAKNPAAVQLGRLGGRKGGPARAKKLTKEQRSKIARKAAQTRWAKRHHQ
jgi:hypothetical protein